MRLRMWRSAGEDFLVGRLIRRHGFASGCPPRSLAGVRCVPMMCTYFPRWIVTISRNGEGLGDGPTDHPAKMQCDDEVEVRMGVNSALHAAEFLAGGA